MKRTVAVAAIFAALLIGQSTASADGYRDGYHRHHGQWSGAHFRHHGDWRWRQAPRFGGYTSSYGSPYEDADEGDYGYPAAPRYAYPTYAGCYSGCAPVMPSCYSYSYGCRPAYSGCGYYGGCGWPAYSRCGGC